MWAEPTCHKFGTSPTGQPEATGRVPSAGIPCRPLMSGRQSCADSGPVRTAQEGFTLLIPDQVSPGRSSDCNFSNRRFRFSRNSCADGGKFHLHGALRAARHFAPNYLQEGRLEALLQGGTSAGNQ